MSPHSDKDRITKLLEERWICFTRVGSRRVNDGMAVRMDDQRSARKATGHFLELGHSKIAMIADSDEYVLSQWRIDGWRSAMVDADLSADELLVPGDLSDDIGMAAARLLLERPARPTAIIACNDQMALAVMEVAREMWLAIPSELSVISFDIPPAVRFSQPALTAIDQPIAKANSRAVELLIEQKKSGQRPDGSVLVEAELIIRDSPAAPPICVSTS